MPSAAPQEAHQIQRVLGLLADDQVELAVHEADQMPRGLARDQMLLSSLPRLARTNLQKAKELAYTISSVELDRVALREITAIEEELIKKVESEISALIAQNEIHQAVDKAFILKPRGEARDRLLVRGLMRLVDINPHKARMYAESLTDKILRESALEQIERIEQDESAREGLRMSEQPAPPPAAQPPAPAPATAMPPISRQDSVAPILALVQPDALPFMSRSDSVSQLLAGIDQGRIDVDVPFLIAHLTEDELMTVFVTVLSRDVASALKTL